MRVGVIEYPHAFQDAQLSQLVETLEVDDHRGRFTIYRDGFGRGQS